MVKKLDKWCDNYWIVFISAVGAAAAIFTAIFWDELPMGALGGIFAAIIMPFHVIEEWKKAGFGPISNEPPYRYGNQCGSAVDSTDLWCTGMYNGTEQCGMFMHASSELL